MTSVKKLVLVPAEEWEEIVKDTPTLGGENYKNVQIPTFSNVQMQNKSEDNLNQTGHGLKEYGNDYKEESDVSNEKMENPTTPPFHSPSPPLVQKKKPQKRGSDEEREKGEGQGEVTWKPPGIPLSRHISRKEWIYL